jgi:DNA replication protein DnaC
MFIDLLVARGIQDEALRGWRFEKADGGNQSNMEIAKIYVDYFMDDFYPRGGGILMWGDVGTGKTFTAACIANALIKKHIPVLMTSFTKINNDIFQEIDKNRYIDSLNHFKLLIIDDLGVERKSDYALENLFTIIDERYKSNKPLIITTNLTLEQLENPEKIEHKRIYDRILEKCTPMAFDGVNMRNKKRAVNFEETKQQISFIRNGG